MSNRKLLVGWFEKLSVAFTAGSVLSGKNFFFAVIVGLLCLAIALRINKGVSNDIH